MTTKINDTYYLLALLETLIIRSENFSKKELVNPSIRTLGTLLFRANLSKHRLRGLNTTYSMEMNYQGYEIQIRFEQISALWVLEVRKNGWYIETKMLYPTIGNFLNFCELFFEHLNTFSAPITPFTIDKFLRKVFPYKYYYLISIDNRLVRFSQFVLERIQNTKTDPVSAVKDIVMLKPRIIDDSFLPEKIEDDILLTYLTLRNMLPAYLLPRPEDIDAHLNVKLDEFLRGIYRVRYLLLESIDNLIEFLSFIFGRIKEYGASSLNM